MPIEGAAGAEGSSAEEREELRALRKALTSRGEALSVRVLALHDRVAECAAARAALANAEAGAGALDEHQRRALRWQAGSVAAAVGRAERKLAVTDDGAAFVAHGIYRGASAAQLHVQAVGRRLTVKIDAVINVTEASSAEVRLPDEAAEHEPMRAELEADGLLRVTVAKAKAFDVEVRQL